MGRVLYGVCGIGLGHVHRALPVIRALAARHHRVVVLSYGVAFRALHAETDRLSGLEVLPVSVPYLPGNRHGLDWAAAGATLENGDPWAVNGPTLAKVERVLGKPDLAISDYEPVTASYAYATGTPLVTLDQQSKFLAAAIPRTGPSGQFGADDEIARLRMFFPKTALRLACSFFPVARLAQPYEDVEIIAPILRDEVLALRRKPSSRRSILVYLSAQETDGLATQARRAAATCPDTDFHIYSRDRPVGTPSPNVTSHLFGDGCFLDLLSSAHGLVCTAGHSLLSEAAYLGIPVMTVPLGLHEQQANARAVCEAGTGMSSGSIDAESLEVFLAALPRLAFAAAPCRTKLLRGTAAEPVIGRLRQWLVR